MKKIVLFGNSGNAEMICRYLKYDSQYEVVAFTVDRAFIISTTLLDLPVVPFEEIETLYPPAMYDMILPISFQKVNRLREQKYNEAKSKGYHLVSYVSSKAAVWPDIVLGDNCIFMEQSVICPFARIGNDVFIGPGAVIGHHVIIEDHTFVSPSAVILGGAKIGPFCLIGANATIREGVSVARECIIGVGSSITKNTVEKGVYVQAPPTLFPKKSDQLKTWLAWPVDPHNPRWGSGSKE